MSDYAGTVKRLRDAKKQILDRDMIDGLLDEAADTIEQLDRENDELRDAVNDMLEEMGELYEDMHKRDEAAIVENTNLRAENINLKEVIHRLAGCDCCSHRRGWGLCEKSRYDHVYEGNGTKCPVWEFKSE